MAPPGQKPKAEVKHPVADKGGSSLERPSSNTSEAGQFGFTNLQFTDKTKNTFGTKGEAQAPSGKWKFDQMRFGGDSDNVFGKRC